ncbi:putative Gluconate transporter [Vibrio nigripulchritudo SFn27]|uniref:Putative Gluconate transporter n=1 Tax=Vibrio nigripulchritudo TaxID=28173 RepID=U4K2D5_9VIBR|nr:GntP family permease [Vibrio nigripulchritudo]CCN83131.1 putative Gluconate transporter [Vibrio nigripulchritudo BLFn1]CCN86265.1 putative Gluconate transporter [Vibrio nigripulchritudo SFn27]CCN92825.1 putative Gluconate transporter [Vibrio nigripulchritudo ENn2]CCO42739.1 putative Gluconate transporter [Vibrio nigripulchritudo SFn135]CCO52606.1 putative Gluconate transporter [Vibrio nigripulchritudo Wn13]
MSLILILLAVIAFIVVATTKFKVHPFLALLVAAFLAAFAYGLPADSIAKTIASGFGGILGYIGLVIVLGTIIGVILEKSGAAITMADTVIKVLGDRFPTLTMTLIGYIVSVPVFCDSGFVILNSLKESLANRLKTSSVAMSVALATGLYATHTFVPPTPGPIAAAGNLGLESNLGLVIAVGIFVAGVAALAGMLWANRFKDVQPDGEEAQSPADSQDWKALKESYGTLPTAGQAFAPIFVPILMICLGSVARFPSKPLGEGFLFDALNFLGQPLTALVIGLLLAVRLLKSDNKAKEFSERISQGITAAAPILLITGAGGAFGAVLKATPLGEYLGTTLSVLGIGILMPFIVAAALKSAQGSSTVALVTTSALVAPLLGQLGLDSEMGRVLTVMAIGAGAMTVSHANDSFFWVVSQFSRMSVGLAYRAQTMATLVQGITAIVLVYILSLVLL